MFTASHNPAQYNGIKMCRAGARRSGRRPAWRRSASWSADADRRPPSEPRARHRARRPAAPTTPRSCTGWSTCRAIRPLRVVVDAGNGMAGHTAPVVLDIPGLTVIPLYFELDGTFPNHEANPIEPDEPARPAGRGPRRRAPTSAWPSTAMPTGASSSTSAGELVSPSALTGLIAARELAKQPGIADHPQPDHVRGGRPRSSARTAARRSARAWATRSSRRSWPRPARCSAASTPGTSTSRTSGAPTPACWPPCTRSPPSAARPRARRCRSCWPPTRYVDSGEINSVVTDAAAATERVRAAFARRAGRHASTTSTG